MLVKQSDWSEIQVQRCNGAPGAETAAFHFQELALYLPYFDLQSYIFWWHYFQGGIVMEV